MLNEHALKKKQVKVIEQCSLNFVAVLFPPLHFTINNDGVTLKRTSEQVMSGFVTDVKRKEIQSDDADLGWVNQSYGFLI